MKTLDAGYAACEAVTRDKAKSFHFASAFLPAAKRRGVYALYDFCRHVDDLVDERGSRPVSAVHADLAVLAAMVRGLEAGKVPADPRWAPFADTILRHEVPIGPLLELIDGVGGDLEPRAFQETEELLRYCHQVAGVVGLALGPLLGARKTGFEEAGAALGAAMQLTNVLRDVAPDAAIGRFYLPAAELAVHGLGHPDLLTGRVDDRWRAFMKGQVARARSYYAAGDAVIPLFPDDGSQLTVRLMQRTYGGILGAIERRGYDVFHGRCHVTAAGKARILAGAWLAGRATSVARLSGG